MRRSGRVPQFRRRDRLDNTVTISRMRIVIIFIAAVVICSGRLQAQAPKAPDTAVLPAANGPVTLNHKAHTTAAYGGKCDSCHHASRPEKAMKGAQEKCGDCHTKAAAAPMKTKLQAAFHDPMAKKGTCIDCHQQAIAKGNTKAPSKCADCHKKIG
jgi:hypothetical protein